MTIEFKMAPLDEGFPEPIAHDDAEALVTARTMGPAEQRVRSAWESLIYASERHVEFDAYGYAFSFEKTPYSLSSMRCRVNGRSGRFFDLRRFACRLDRLNEGRAITEASLPLDSFGSAGGEQNRSAR